MCAKQGGLLFIVSKIYTQCNVKSWELDDNTKVYLLSNEELYSNDDFENGETLHLKAETLQDAGYVENIKMQQSIFRLILEIFTKLSVNKIEKAFIFDHRKCGFINCNLCRLNWKKQITNNHQIPRTKNSNNNF